MFWLREITLFSHNFADFFQDKIKTKLDLNFKTKTLKILSRPRPSLVFKTKTKTLHLKTKTFLWCILEADRKVFFIFGRKRKCRRKINSIYGRKRNENINGHSFSQRAGCSKAEPKNFAPPQTAFPEARDGQNLISWRWSLPLHTLNQFGEDRCTQFRVIMVTDPRHPPTHKHTHPQKKTIWLSFCEHGVQVQLGQIYWICIVYT